MKEYHNQSLRGEFTRPLCVFLEEFLDCGLNIAYDVACDRFRVAVLRIIAAAFLYLSIADQHRAYENKTNRPNPRHHLRAVARKADLKPPAPTRTHCQQR